MDYQLFKIINSLAGKNAPLDYFFIFLATYLIIIMAAGAIIFIWRQSKNFNKKIWSFFQLILAAGLAYLFNNLLLQQIYFRSRPFVANDAVVLIEKSSAEKSFPSDHAALAFAVATTIYIIDRRVGKIFITGAFFVALGRILVGVHYPLDVVAGAGVGVLFAFAARKVVQVYAARNVAKK